MAVNLSMVAPTRMALPPRILVHGGPKVGKSTFFAGAPAPIFIQTEDGLGGIDTAAFPLATHYNQVVEALNSLITEEHDFQTVVLDSADWLEKLIWEQICDDEKVTCIEKACGGYGKGFAEANVYWRQILRLLERLRNERSMIIGIVCHSKIISISEPHAESYDKYRLKLHSPKSGNGAADALYEWHDILGFAAHDVFITASNDGRASKAAAAGTRSLYLGQHPAFETGNRYNLPDKIPLSWAAFDAEMRKSVEAHRRNKPAANDPEYSPKKGA